MDGVSRAAGSGVPIEWEGETLILEPLGLVEFGILEQHLLKERPDPIQVARQMIADMALPESVQEKLVAEAYRDAKQGNFASNDDINAFMQTPTGLSYAFWVSFEKRYPGRFKRDEVLKIVDSMGTERQNEMFAALMQASGLDERGNATGPAKSGAQTTSEPSATR